MSTMTWMGLILCNLVWAINPTIAKQIMRDVGPEHTALLKYTVALGFYLIFMIFLRFSHRKTRRKAKPILMPAYPRAELWTVVAIGFATCFLSPMTQVFGLQASSAANNCILVTFEPLFTVLFGWILYRERLSHSHYGSFFLATLGFLFLSRFLNADLSGFRVPSFQIGSGDFILLIGVACEALYSVLARRLTRNHSGSTIFGTAMLVGVVLLAAVILPWKGLPPLHRLSFSGWLTVVWFGVFGTAVPDLYWLYALSRSLSLGSVVLSLFLQPLIGTAVAVAFLGEKLGTHHLIGGALILSAVLFQILAEKRRDLPRDAITLP